MRAAVLTEPGTVEIRERARPSPDPNEVIVSIEAVGVCGSDRHYYEHGRIGDYVVEEPLVLGHESAGTVVEVGDAVAERTVGERVALEPGVPCGECHHCRSGTYNRCPAVRFMATPPHDGAFVEAVAWPADFATPLPSSLAVEPGALAEPVSVALHACRRGDVGAGDAVLVTGGGPVGLLCADVALAVGATDVVLSEPVASKRTRARERGVTATADPTSDEVPVVAEGHCDGPVDVAIEATGDPEALTDCVESVGRGGTVVCVGLGDDVTVPLDVVNLVDRELTVRGSFRFANTYDAAVDLLASGAVDAASLLDVEVGLAAVETALERAGEPDVVKCLVRPQE